ncbi:RNA polymerase sigma factor RpoD/SigA [Plantactinospora siamensis]|uniref:RNA polymerase sigma factor RpoD/SigA n=1 Tax=Plantactinospora siamensis TaxID=555372 RepID=A0ABV6NPH9_9ACTN
MSAAVLPSASVSAALVDELRMILDRHEGRRAQSLVADFAVRHHLTHNDVDALLVMLTRQRATGHTTAPPAAVPPAPIQPFRSTSIENLDPQATSSDGPPAAGQGDLDVDEEDGDDDLAWMFGDVPEPSTSPATGDGLVAKAFEDLFGDWARTGGKLTRADVALLATRRELSAAQHGELLSLLESAGVEPSASVESGAATSAIKGFELHGDSVRQYLREIGRYPLVNAAREVELWALMQQGDAARRTLDSRWDELSRDDRRSLRDRIEAGRDAHAAMVCANLRLVVSIAKAGNPNQTGVEFADRIQDGNLGLMHAAHLFDGSKGYKFSTYATWWIKQSIERGVANHSRTIRIPVHLHEKVRKVAKTARKLTARLDREPTLAELAEATGMDAGRVQAMLDHLRPVVSIDLLFGDGGDLRLSDILVDEQERDGRADPAEIIGHAMLAADIDRTLRKLLPERSVRVLQRRFGLGTGEQETLDEIAADYGVTRERIRQIQVKAMKTLEEHEGAAGLRSYLTDEQLTGRVAVPPKGKRDE